jgi:hypothetical protein
MRKTVVPEEISKVIGSFGLSEEVLLELLGRLHTTIAEQYDLFRMDRQENDDRFYLRRMTIVDGHGRRHIFALAIDDSTSPDHLFITSITYRSRPV